MQSRESSQIRVGVFVFLGLLVAMILIFFLGTQKQVFKRHYILRSYFQEVTGLRVGASVQLAGISIGAVENIQLDAEPLSNRIEVRLSLNREFQDKIRADSVVSLQTQGLLGDKIISITMGSADQNVLQDGDILSSKAGAGFESITEKGSAMVGDLGEAAKSLKEILREVEKGDGLLHSVVYESKDRALAANLSASSRELRQILEKINKGEGTIGALIADPSLYEDLRRILKNVERNKILTHIIRSRVRDLELEKVDSKPAPNSSKK